MKSLSDNILGKFLSSTDYNLKYIALNTLKDVVKKRFGKCTKTSCFNFRISKR